ncbi:MAG: hypothetical protein HC890_10385 [Chloroflexaceae bacterium]|nr:hypothetical protein [Chloroflexaceae bacterium]
MIDNDHINISKMETEPRKTQFMANLEETVLTTFRQLSGEQQQEVLQFLEFIQASPPLPPTVEEKKRANQIITKGLEKARLAPPQSPVEIWSKFEQVRTDLSNQYQTKIQNS